MSGRIIVTAIDPIDFGQKRVHLIDTKTGVTFERIYGDSVSDRWIRIMAPRNLEKGK